MTDKISIPNKSHFTFDEVATITGVKKYVLRFWETEFDEIDPMVSSAGQKLFEHKDIDAILKIKKLLFDDKHAIEKAKAILLKGDSTEESVVDGFKETRLDEQVLVSNESAVSDVPNISSNIAPLKEKLIEIIKLADSLEERYDWK